MRILLLVVLALTALPARAQAAELIVQREPGLDRAERGDVRRQAGVTLVDTLTLPDTEVVRAGDPQAALAALNADPDVRYAELDRSVSVLSADPYFGQEWGLENTGQFSGTADADMDVPEAWMHSVGGGVTVAVVDTGVDADVPDLAGQLTGNGVDDDHNGFVDDSRGWDFSSGDNDPTDQHGHGTHVAGTVAALVGNGIGVAGVAPGVKLIPIRVLNSSGSGSDSGIAQGFDYAGDLGVRIVNASLGGPGSSATLTAAMAAHPDTLYVIAAGNDHADDDASPVYPCTSPAPNVLCVGASEVHDQRASFSNYGATTVDVFAPGQWIKSTLKGGGYDFMSGTSMAAPNVAGAAALALAANPTASTAQLKAALMTSVDRVPALAGLAVTGGRVNAAAATAALAGATPEPPAQPVATPAPPSATLPPAAPPASVPVEAAAVRRLTLSGALRGRNGRLRASFTLTRGTPVRVSVALRGRAKAATASWSVTARPGANLLRFTRRVRGRTLPRGRYTLTVSAPGGARTAVFSVR